MARFHFCWAYGDMGHVQMQASFSSFSARPLCDDGLRDGGGGSTYEGVSAAPRFQKQSEREIRVAKKLLAAAQEYSLVENIEICGYLGITEDGEFTSTDLNRGQERSCTLPPVPPNMRVLSIFHSHGAYDPFFDRELPSSDDARLSLEYLEDNYLVTPGGRV